MKKENILAAILVAVVSIGTVLGLSLYVCGIICSLWWATFFLWAPTAVVMSIVMLLAAITYLVVMIRMFNNALRGRYLDE